MPGQGMPGHPVPGLDQPLDRVDDPSDHLDRHKRPGRIVDEDLAPTTSSVLERMKSFELAGGRA